MNGTHYTVVFFLIFSGSLWAQLSPGDLAQAHSKLEGLRNCTLCHEIGNKDFKDKCLACHTTLKKRIELKEGLHAQAGYDVCQKCHVDHHGKEFALIRETDLEQFAHDDTGYKIEGKHGELECRDCHKAQFIKSPESLQKAGKDLERTFLGLEGSCIQCHTDIHSGELSENCQDCHDQSSWKPASGFDHQTARFHLEGKHGELECQACHPKAENHTEKYTSLIFKPLEFEQCTSCHGDEHRGQLAGDCTDCHNLEAWKPAPLFSHRQTRFPLTGAHQNTQCKACHPRVQGSIEKPGYTRFSPIASDNCSRCHEDVHENRLGSNCESCHNTGSWSRYKKSAFDHDQTAYPLTGVHETVACKACHGDHWKKIPSFSKCEDCHGDAHSKQISYEPYPDGCESCHSTVGFVPALFTVERHQQVSFHLEGSHLAIPCIACHPQMEDGAGRRFSYSDLNCLSCHEDFHEGRVNAIMEKFQWEGQMGCETCHNVHSWDASVFDHKTTHFQLTGVHETVSCKKCHGSDGDGGFPLRFTPTSGKCSDCHEDQHFGQFTDKEKSGKSCESCHGTQSWKAVNFNHDSDTRFSLKGAHSNVDCAACHPVETSGGTKFTRFKPLAVECAACHIDSSNIKELQP